MAYNVLLISLMCCFLVGCSSTRQMDYNYSYVPPSIQKILDEAEAGRFDQLDSLIEYSEDYEGYDRLREKCHLFEIQKKYMKDFALAYDKNESAFARLEKAMYTKNNVELFHLFFGLFEIDSLRARNQLTKVISNSVELQKDSLVIGVLKQLDELPETQARGKRFRDSVSAKEMPKDFNPKDPQGEILLKYGAVHLLAESGHRKNHQLLQYFLQYGDSLQYQRARRVLLEYVDSCSRYFTPIVSLLGDWLMYPVPGDTVNDQQSVSDVLQYLLHWEYCDSIVVSTMEKQSRRSGFLSSGQIVLVNGKSDISEDSLCAQKIYWTSDSLEINEANLKGNIHFSKVSIRAYQEYAYVNVSQVFSQPVWKYWKRATMPNGVSNLNQYSRSGPIQHFGSTYNRIFRKISNEWKYYFGKVTTYRGHTGHSIN